MICSCPKCAAEVEVDNVQIKEEGTSISCPECKARFWISEESTVRRALKKEGKLYCFKCSNELNHLVVCSSCGFLYPDYFVVQTSKPVKRQVQKIKEIRSSSLQPMGISYAGSQRSSVRSAKTLPLIIGVVALMAVLAIGFTLYHQKSREHDFVSKYVVGIYAINSGKNLSLSQCTKFSEDWKAKTGAGQSAVPQIGPEEEAKLNDVRSEVDRMMHKLDDPPKKYTKAKEKLERLNGAYLALHSLALTPSGPLPRYTELVAKADTDYKAAVQDLKSNLTAELSEEVKKAKSKYIAFRDF